MNAASAARFIAYASIAMFVAVDAPWNTTLSRARLGVGALIVVALLWDEED